MEMASVSAAKIVKVPFEQLPNLPKPVVPELNLAIDNIPVTPSILKMSKRRIGYYLRDKSSQTEESEILDLKRVTTAMQALTQDVLLLRKDLNYAQNVMKADYQAKITERATTLYCRMNKRLKELEMDHRDKLSRLRNSYRTQLSDAVKKIAGEYKAYYEELLSGKTDRHDIIIKQLKEQASELSRFLEEKESELELAHLQLKESRMQLQSEEERSVVVTPPISPTGVSNEKHMELLQAMNLLQEELRDLQINASQNEATIRKLKKDNESLTKQLNKEREKLSQIQNDYDAYKKKAVEEQSQANKLAKNQLAALEKEMKQQMYKDKEKALIDLQQKADMEKMQSEARHMQELSARKTLEEQMAKEINSLSEQESIALIEKLQKIEAKQKKQIERLEHELVRTNKAWEMKLTIMQRNFHALKDEAFIRHSLQRQAAALHHATVGYTVQGTNSGNEERIHSNFPKPKPLVRCQDMDPVVTQGSGRNSSTIAANTTGGLQSLSSVLIPPAPSPSPNHVQWRQDRGKSPPKTDSIKSRAVQFDINSNDK